MDSGALFDGAFHQAAPSWESIFRENSQKVFRQALRLTGNWTEAEDLTQDVFVRVFRSLSSFRPGSFDGWLYRITVNLFLDQVRLRSRVRMSGLPENVADRLASSIENETPHGGYAYNNFDSDIAKALAALPKNQRIAVVLCDLEDLSYQEIAHALDWKLGTVRSRINRGRAALRKTLAHRGEVRRSQPSRGAAEISEGVDGSNMRERDAGERPL